MIGGTSRYFPQNFKHIDTGMDKIEAEVRKGLNYLWHVHYKWNMQNGVATLYIWILHWLIHLEWHFPNIHESLRTVKDDNEVKYFF